MAVSGKVSVLYQANDHKIIFINAHIDLNFKCKASVIYRTIGTLKMTGLYLIMAVYLFQMFHSMMPEVRSPGLKRVDCPDSGGSAFQVFL